jgi:hypothetical protein
MKKSIPVSPLAELTRKSVQRDPRVLERFRLCYAWLAQLPRWTRRRLAHGLRRKLAMTLAAAALLIAVSGMPVYAATITVDTGARGINSGDGCSLVEAIVNANDDAQIYDECDPGTGDDTITMPTDEEIAYSTPYGPTPAAPLYTALPDITETLTIEGNGSIIGRLGIAPDFRILSVSAGDFVLNNATITGGHVPVSPSGGGIYASGGTVSLDHVTVTANTADDGGGIALENSSLTADYLYVTDNYAVESGGGIDAFNSNVTLTNSEVIGNIAYEDNGGGILFDAHDPQFTLSVTDSEISGNKADESGGGISAFSYYDENFEDFYAIVNVTDSVISGNTAGVGGGVALYQTRATIRGSTISDNGTPPTRKTRIGFCRMGAVGLRSTTALWW